MATITLMFDPEYDSKASIVSMVDTAYADAEPVDDLDDDDGTEPARGRVPDGWSLSRMRRYVRELAPTGLTALRAIAEDAPAAHIDVVKAATGLIGMEYAGAMSTFGHAKRNAYGVHHLPFRRHGDTYYMDERVALMALDALAEMGA